MAKLSYRQVKDIYDSLYDTGALTQSLPEWSQAMNALSGTDLYASGLNDNLVKRASVGIDRLLEATGIPNALANVGEEVGSWVGDAQTGRDIGQGTLRGVVNFLPTLLGGGLGRVATGLLAGGQTYTETDSVGAGAISGLVAGAMPTVANAAEQATLRVAGAPLLKGLITKAPGVTEAISTRLPQNLVQGWGAQGAGQVAASAFGEVGRAAQAGLDPERDYEFSPTSALLEMTLGQFPFGIVQLAGSKPRLGGKTTKDLEASLKANMAQTALVQKQQTAAAEAKARGVDPIAQVPDVVPQTPANPVVLEQINTKLEQLRNAQRTLLKESTAMSMEEFNKLSQAENAELAAAKGYDGTGVAGVKQTNATPRTMIVGTPHYVNKDGTFRMVKTPDGRVVGYSTLGEPPAVPSAQFPGQFEFSIPEGYWSEFQDNRQPKTGVAQPELPQGPEATGYFDHVGPLAEVTAKLESAKTNVELQDALVQLNSVRQMHNMPPLTDAQVVSRARLLDSAGDVRKGAKSAVAKTKRDIDALHTEQERMRAAGDVEGLDVVRENRGTMSGQPLVSLPKLDAETGPIHDIFDSLITSVQLAKDSSDSLALWQKGSNSADKTSLPVEHERFKKYWALRAMGDIEGGERLSDADLETFFESLDPLVRPTNPEVLRDFGDRDHVLNWDDAVNERVAEMRGGSAAPNYAPEPGVYVPTADEAPIVAELGLDRGAQGSVDYVLKNAPAGSWLQTLAQDFGQYPAMLSRVKAHFVRGDEPSQAFHDAARRTGIIRYSSDIIHTIPEVRMAIVLHEVAHQLTLAEIDNPTKVHLKSQLDDLRSRVATTLTAADKTRFANAQASDFLSRWAKGEASWAELGPNGGLLYGLLNTKEFVSQGLTSGAVRKHLLMVEGKKGNYWNKFKGLVRSVLGLNPQTLKGSAWDEFLDYTSGLMDQGEFVASFHNFGERFLENKGYSNVVANAAVRQGAALVHHSAALPMGSGDVVEFLMGQKVPTPQLDRALNNLNRMLAKGDEGTSMVMQELGYTPDLRGINDFVTEVLRGETHATDALAVVPDEVSAYVFEKLKSMRDVVEMTEAAASAKNKGLVNLGAPERLTQPLAEARKAFDKMLAHERLTQQGRMILDQIQGVEPGGFWSKWSNPDEVPGSGAPLGEWWGDVKKKMDRFFRPIAQYTDPRLREIFAKGFQLVPNTNKMFHEATKVFGLDMTTGKLSKDAVKQAEKLVKDKVIAGALDKWLYENNVAGKVDGAKLLPLSDPRVARHVSKLSAEQKDSLAELMAKHNLSKQIFDQQTLEKMEQIATLDAAKLLGRHNDLKVEQNLALTSAIWNAVKADWQNPAEAAAAQNVLAQVQGKMTPEAFNDTLTLTQNSYEAYKLQKEFFDANPAWSSAQRSGKYRVKFFENGKVQVHGADSRKHAEQLAGKNKIVEFYEAKRQGDEDLPHFGSDYQQIFERLNELHQRAQEIRKTRGYSPEELAIEDKLSPALQFARETEGQGLSVPTAPPRGLTRGAENLPWLSNHFSWLKRSSSYWNRRLFRAQMDAYIAQKEIPDDMKADLRTHRDNILMQDPDSVNTINSFVRTWFMGFNPANVIINAAQPFTTHVAELTSLTGKPLDSYRRAIGALKEIAGFKWGNKDWSDPEIKKLMDDALSDGEVGLSAYDDDANVQKATALNLKEVIDGSRPKTLGQRAESLGNALSNAGMWLFQHGEQINNRAALIASFKLFREQGLPYAEAKAKAYDFNHRVNFGGGRAQRPVGMFSGRSPVLRGTAMLATSMQSYVLGTTFQILRYLKAGGFRPKGLTPHEVWSARKAGVQMLGTQLAAAGLLGLPFVSAALGLIDKTFPALEVNKNLRESVNSFFGEDDEEGGVMTDIAMTGIPSMLGWDLQSRLSMGNTLPGVSEVNGFQPENLLGPPANLVATFLEGGRKLLTGDLAGARAFVPSAAKKVADLFAGEGKLQDYRDREILDPTPGEKIGVLLGFQPKRLSDYNAARRMAELSEKNESRERGQLHQQLAEETLKGNIGTVRAQLREVLHQRPTTDIVQEIRAIARVAEELTFPRDLRREGRSPNRSRLLSSFGNLDSVAEPGEVTRLQFRQQTEQSLGLLGQSRGDLELAMVMDRLRLENPSATRADLRRQAERLTRLAKPSLSLE